MHEPVKEYFAAFGKWGFLVATIIVGDVIGIIQSYNTAFLLPTWAWWLILVIILLLTPYLAFRHIWIEQNKLRQKLDDIENSKPIIEAIPKIYGNHAILEITNKGGEADFNAIARVKGGMPQDELYTMCWQPICVEKRHINRDESASIFVGEISPNTVYPNEIVDDTSTFIYRRGLALYKMGNSGNSERFGVTTPKAVDAKRLRERYPTMFKEAELDECILEITVSSSPTLLKPFTRGYFLSINNNEIKFKELPDYDKADYPNL